MAQREKIFLAELKETFADLDIFWQKIADDPVSFGSRRFNKGKPFDVFIVYRGHPIAIEAKYTPGYRAFGIDTLRDSQRDGLEAFERAGGKSFIFLNVRQKLDKEKKIPRLNRLMIFTWQDLKKEEQNFKKKELLDMPYVDGAKGAFPLDFITNAVNARLYG